MGSSASKLCYGGWLKTARNGGRKVLEVFGNIPGMLGGNEKSQASLSTFLFCFARDGQVRNQAVLVGKSKE